MSYSAGSVDITGTHAEDMKMTLHRDFSAPVSTGEGACGGLVNRVFIPTYEVLGNCRLK